MWDLARRLGSLLHPTRPARFVMIAATEAIVFIAALLFLIAVIAVDLWL
jgi:hypothetical protein